MGWFIINSGLSVCERASIEHEPKRWSIRSRVVHAVSYQRKSGELRPFREKLLVIEAIWDDILREEEALEMPQWH